MTDTCQTPADSMVSAAIVDARNMRKADRLFEIIQILRRSKKPVTADAMAEELETSKRSVYRDITALMAQRVPIRGEAGIGYVLERGLDMPPLMLTTDEIEAAVLGAQWVMNRGDPQLAKAARDLMAKIEASVPERLRPYIEEPAARVSRTCDARSWTRLISAACGPPFTAGRRSHWIIATRTPARASASSGRSCLAISRRRG